MSLFKIHLPLSATSLSPQDRLGNWYKRWCEQGKYVTSADRPARSVFGALLSSFDADRKATVKRAAPPAP